MANYFTSDWHLGHKVIIKYRKQFSTIEEHDEAIFKEMDKLKKRDIERLDDEKFSLEEKINKLKDSLLWKKNNLSTILSSGNIKNPRELINSINSLTCDLMKYTFECSIRGLDISKALSKTYDRWDNKEDIKNLF